MLQGLTVFTGLTVMVAAAFIGKDIGSIYSLVVSYILGAMVSAATILFVVINH